MNLRNPFLILALSMATVATSAGQAPTEPRDLRPDRRPQPPIQQRDAGMPPGRMAGAVDFMRILNEEQREAFRQAMQSTRSRLREIEEQIPQLRREIEESVFAMKLDEESIRQKTRALADLETDRTLLRARAMAAIRPSLSEDQLRQIKAALANLGRLRRPDGPGIGRPADVRDNPARRPGEPEREGADLPPPRRSQPGPRNL